ncbi:gliding motility protein [Streptomyces sp. NPDC006274]|uniref:gliding motility protein n=1 Tax=unclassified Streptomyces TaxID=2593676 RepID=UPI00339FACD1
MSPLAAQPSADEASEVTDGAAPAGDPAAVAGSAPAEAVEIPKQQSAEDAADSETGEGART